MEPQPDRFALRQAGLTILELLVVVAVLGLVAAIAIRQANFVSGGLKAVVYTDAVQLVIMFVGALLIVGIGLYDPEVGVGGIEGLRQSLEAQGHRDHFSLFLPHDSRTPFPWTGVFVGLALVLAPAYFIGNQAIVQRTLGARDEWSAKAGTWWSTCSRSSPLESSRFGFRGT